MMDIDIDQLHVSKLNVRHDVGEQNSEGNTIDSLAHSINEVGLIDPLIVRENDDSTGYEIIAGQRRYLACLKLRVPTIKCIVIPTETEDDMAEYISLVENVHKVELSKSDKVRAYNKLIALSGKDANWLAEMVNASRSTINKYIKLGNLPDDLLDRLDIKGENKLTKDVALTLVDLPANYDKDAIIEEIKDMKDMGLPTKEAIKVIKTAAKNKQAIKPLASQAVAKQAQKAQEAKNRPWVNHPQTGEPVPIPDNILKQIQTLMFPEHQTLTIPNIRH